jgi:hypothetical protein
VEEPGYGDSTKRLSSLYTADRKQIDPQHHTSCPGHAVFVDEDYVWVAPDGTEGAGLVSSGLRGRIQQNARSRMSTPAGQAFVAARDPKRAEAARLGRSIQWRPAARATFRAARTGAGRLGTEVVCANTDCGAVFCPLNQAKRRQFCTRSCASRYARATARRDLTPRPSED